MRKIKSQNLKFPTIALLNYGMGNLHSVSKALETVGAKVDWITSADQLKNHDAIVLPGVGNFGDGIAQLHERGFFSIVKNWVDEDKPFLGICLGMQMLLEGSEEAPGVSGLGICKGKVKKFRPKSSELKVPQMGWNTVTVRGNCPLFYGIENESYFYFVHSFYADTENQKVVGGETDYVGKYCSFIWKKNNVFATQFHPEKSQKTGLKLLENFVDLLTL
jgi:glutamine amidotransferase